MSHYLAVAFGVVAAFDVATFGLSLVDDDAWPFGAVTGVGLAIVTPSNFLAIDNESSFAVVVFVDGFVVFDFVPVAVVAVFGLFFSDFTPLPPVAGPVLVAVSLVSALFFGSSLLLFAAVSLAGAAAFVVWTATVAAFGFGSVVGDALENVFFGVSNVDFVDEPSNFFAISNESISNESRFAVDGFGAFFVGVDFLSSPAFDLSVCSDGFS